MKNKKIILSVKRGMFRVDDPESEMSDREFKKVRSDVLKRDKNTCQYCGFESSKFQEVHHIDDNHANNDMSNLITTCSLCHMCHHIGYAGVERKGWMIWLDPELGFSQSDLNSLIRQAWIAETSDNKEIKFACQSLCSKLQSQIISATRRLGDADPAMLGSHMMKLNEEQYSRRSQVLKGIYFLPRKEGFKRQFEYWASVQNKNNPTSKWAGTTQNRLGKWLENEYGVEPTLENIVRYIKTKGEE